MILTVETRRTGTHCHSAAGANRHSAAGANCHSAAGTHCHSAAMTTVTDSSGGEHHVHD